MNKAQRERIEELIKRAQRMGNEKDNVGKVEEEMGKTREKARLHSANRAEKCL